MSKSVSSNRLKVCFVIDDLPSQFETSDDANIAEWLTQAGHSVTLLATRIQEWEVKSIKKWHSYYTQRSINFIPFSYQGPAISSLLPAVRSYHILHWLLDHATRFQVIHFPLANGLAYYPLLAKHQGWAFQQVEFCVESQASTIWRKSMHQQWIDQVDDLAADFLERESIRLTDRMISRSNDLLHWMKQQGWQLPKTVHPFSEIDLQDDAKVQWLSLYDKIEAENCQKQSETKEGQEEHHPLVSICVTHFNRPHYLAQALDSIRSQDYPNFEVILVDDASTLPEAQTYLDSLVQEFESKSWQIIRNPKNLFPGAARNLAARRSRGEYLLFMDDDNYANSHQVTTFVQVARQVNADILTCAMDVFEGHDTPQNATFKHRFLPMGAAASVGLYFNLFGDINALIKKTVYESLNGLTEDHGVGGEDWELFGRAVLKGYHLEAIPLALFWYRDTPRSITKTTHLHANYLRGMRSYLDVVPPALRGNMMLSQAQQEKLNQLMQDHQNLGKLLNRCWQLFSSRALRVLCKPSKILKKITKRLFKTANRY